MKIGKKAGVWVILVIMGAMVFTGCGSDTPSSSNYGNTSPSTGTNSSYSNSSSSEFNGNSSSYGSETWTKTAGETNGYDWENMTREQKESLVQGVINAWRDNGTAVTADNSWFIEALDAFYGDPATNNTNVAEAISLAGVAGGVLNSN